MFPTAEMVLEMTRGAVPPHLRGKVGDDDLSQEVLLRVYSPGHEGRFDGRGDAEVRRFLKKTMASVIKDMVRRFDTQKRRAALEGSLDQALDGSSARLAVWLADDRTSPSQAVVRQELLDRLNRGLAALPEDQRSAVELFHIQGLKAHEVEERMGKTPSAVAGLLCRGLKALREHMERR